MSEGEKSHADELQLVYWRIGRLWTELTANYEKLGSSRPLSLALTRLDESRMWIEQHRRESKR
jgi:hypothetical protein